MTTYTEQLNRIAERMAMSRYSDIEFYRTVAFNDPKRVKEEIESMLPLAAICLDEMATAIEQAYIDGWQDCATSRLGERIDAAKYVTELGLVPDKKEK